ncbi:MAG: hypothetical protein PHU71_02715 [Candidatus Gracilibacteria bacterium]|nr:hypothetical protein [Candidatus Gracilibacteria bacterium]
MNLRKLNKLENSHPEAVSKLLDLGFKPEYNIALWREALLKVINGGRADLPRYLQPNLPRSKQTLAPKREWGGVTDYIPMTLSSGLLMLTRVDDGTRPRKA